MFGNYPHVSVPENEVPTEWIEEVKNGAVGGVVLVYVSGKNLSEVEEKKQAIMRYAKRIKKKYGKDRN